MTKTNLFIISAVIIFLDIITKYLVILKMRLGEIIELPLGFVQLHYIRNRGAAFGMLQDQRIFFIFACFLVLGLIVYFFDEIKKYGFMCYISSCLIFGGAIGNLIDRIRWGYVVDFIDLKWWPIFNVADIALTIGMVLMCLMAFGVGVPKEVKAAAESSAESDSEAEPSAASPQSEKMSAESAENSTEASETDK